MMDTMQICKQAGMGNGPIQTEQEHPHPDFAAKSAALLRAESSSASSCQVKDISGIVASTSLPEVARSPAEEGLQEQELIIKQEPEEPAHTTIEDAEMPDAAPDDLQDVQQEEQDNPGQLLGQTSPGSDVGGSASQQDTDADLDQAMLVYVDSEQDKGCQVCLPLPEDYPRYVLPKRNAKRPADWELDPMHLLAMAAAEQPSDSLPSPSSGQGVTGRNGYSREIPIKHARASSFASMGSLDPGSNWSAGNDMIDPASGDNDDVGPLMVMGVAKRARLAWTPELHAKFVKVVDMLGPCSAVPKTILNMMNVKGLTREQVASHLQKYRLHLRKGGSASTMGHTHSAGGSGETRTYTRGATPPRHVVLSRTYPRAPPAIKLEDLQALESARVVETGTRGMSSPAPSPPHPTGRAMLSVPVSMSMAVAQANAAAAAASASAEQQAVQSPEGNRHLTFGSAERLPPISTTPKLPPLSKGIIHDTIPQPAAPVQLSAQPALQESVSLADWSASRPDLSNNMNNAHNLSLNSSGLVLPSPSAGHSLSFAEGTAGPHALLPSMAGQSFPMQPILIQPQQHMSASPTLQVPQNLTITQAQLQALKPQQPQMPSVNGLTANADAQQQNMAEVRRRSSVLSDGHRQQNMALHNAKQASENGIHGTSPRSNKPHGRISDAGVPTAKHAASFQTQLERSDDNMKQDTAGQMATQHVQTTKQPNELLGANVQSFTAPAGYRVVIVPPGSVMGDVPGGMSNMTAPNHSNGNLYTVPGHSHMPMGNVRYVQPGVYASPDSANVSQNQQNASFSPVQNAPLQYTVLGNGNGTLASAPVQAMVNGRPVYVMQQSVGSQLGAQLLPAGSVVARNVQPMQVMGSGLPSSMQGITMQMQMPGQQPGPLTM